jgi:serine/threonine protein phosphatase PrpC
MTTYVSGTISERGGREVNEDACAQAVRDGLWCWCVADGLGGHSGGELASRLAVDAALSMFKQHPECSPEALRTYVEAAHRAVIAGRAGQPAHDSMRTTIVLLLATTERALWAHCGDSRLYQLRRGAIVQQTRDHSLAQAMVDGGSISSAELRSHPDRNRLLKSLGEGDAPKATYQTDYREIVSGDAFLLASDGFWEPVTETEIEAEYAKAPAPDDWLSGMLVRLRARVRDGHDNYSATAIFRE